MRRMVEMIIATPKIDATDMVVVRALFASFPFTRTCGFDISLPFFSLHS